MYSMLQLLFEINPKFELIFFFVMCPIIPAWSSMTLRSGGSEGMLKAIPIFIFSLDISFKGQFMLDSIFTFHYNLLKTLFTI